MTIELKRKILDLIESPELQAYLMTHTERLRLRDYVSIIAGAPISLKGKQKLLHSLEAISGLKQTDLDYIKLCCECVDSALQYLVMKNEIFFLIQLMGYDDDNKSEVADGPYIAASLSGAKRAVRSYYDDEPGTEWQTLYWRMELYIVKQNENRNMEFLSPEYTYIMDRDGEILYFIHERRTSNYLRGYLGSMAEDQFYSVCPNLNLPVPYQPGDVLFVDCRPYAPDAFYCRIKEVGDDCCGIQCEYVTADGNLETGALKHGDYFDNHRESYQYLSPLYRARIVSKDELDWDDYVRRKQEC